MMQLKNLRGLREVSLFTGAGGGILSSKLLGWETIAYVEWDKYCQTTLRARITDGVLDDAPIFDDVGSFDGNPFRGKADIVTAGFPCFVAGTMILAIQGYVPIENIQVGDLVLTHMGRWRRVSAIMRRTEAPLQEVKAQDLPYITCTRTHPFHAKSFEGTRRVEAQELKPGTHLIGQVLPPVEDDLCSDAYWELVGCYLACGYISADTVVFEGPLRVVTRIENVIRDAGFQRESHSSATKTDAWISIFSQDLLADLTDFGTRPEAKSIPGWALQLPEPKAKALLRGFFATGRIADSAGWRAHTKSKAMALSLMLLAQRAYGVAGSVCLSNLNEYEVRIPKPSPAFMVEDGYIWRPVQKSENAGVGDVYNIAVEEDHTYIADGVVVMNCQPFSVAGRQGAQNDERNRWPDTIRVIREVQPRFAFLENVPGLLAGSHGYFGTILGDLAASGYDAVWSCLPAAAVGAPHRRDRLWVLAHRK